MPQCCAVPMCSNKTGGHKFPFSDKTRLKQWVEAICRAKFTPTKYSIVCKSHFTADDYELPKDSVLENPRPVLKKNAVPSQFSWNKKGSSNPKKNKLHQRLTERNEKNSSVQVRINNEKQQNATFLINSYEVEIEFEKQQKDIGIQCDLGQEHLFKSNSRMF